MYELPIFPLNTVLFPGMPLRLHIFEPRYQEMMEHVLKTSRTFGVAMIRSGQEARGPLPEPSAVGCTARVIQVEPLGDGRMNLTAVGDERYRVLRMGLNTPYWKAFVESAPLQMHHTLEVVRGVRLLRLRVTQYLGLLGQYSEQPGSHDEGDDLNFDLTALELPEDPMMLIYLAAALLQLPPSEKQPMLEADTAQHLLDKIQRLYRRELAVLPPILKYDEEEANHAAGLN